MKSSGLIVVSRPITPTTSAYLMLEDNKSFNPAFYNTTQISQKQAIYNERPHSVCIAYFGNGLAKEGIMSVARPRATL